ncbi:carbon-nitrogen hydrolase family protein [Pseudoroseicyclus tamaricis]|uniref:Carbon-nitrogen hydrolase family protein n=1 Tax=Pseudoroseicyclus tamaricis TaxID=2705421 RepID=A0A6B2JUK3_9RHOB|nr:carbon-nitrogen hydrolase family protein [Pseudoroseicyclus tamaricis]NDV01740.1 carbon-nitrogen hydrolase family protein [Pseudoroseicyclus tamaricis]
MKIAVSGYAPEWLPDWAALEESLAAHVGGAVAQGAELLVYPEYGGVASGLIGQPEGLDAAGWADRLAERAEAWVGLNAHLAKAHGVHVLAGSTCVRLDGHIVNRTWLCTPDGATGHQDKAILTPYERDDMQLSPGQELNVFDTALGRIGVLICYDSEFPLLARGLVEAGAEMLLVPSYTDLPAGATRVRESCRARAIEQQCLVVNAPLAGACADCEIYDVGTGRPGLFCPPDVGQPPSGILAEAQSDAAPGWLIAEVDPAAISMPRLTGAVGNHAQWAEQKRVPPPGLISLK